MKQNDIKQTTFQPYPRTFTVSSNARYIINMYKFLHYKSQNYPLRGILQTRNFERFHKIHSKTPAGNLFFNEG